MIELAFSDSAAGSLKMTKKKAGDPLADAGDVAGLSLFLEIGDISDMDTGMSGRNKMLDELFGKYPGVSGEIWDANKSTLARLEKVKTTQESVRMWICEGNPSELCGFYFICHMMADVGTSLYVVRIPEQIENDSGIVSYRNMAEIRPEELIKYAKYEMPVSVMQRQIYANMWKELARKNAPLRAVLNGALMGVPEDFYDFALRANMPEGEFRIAHLIGRTLGSIPGIGDQWLYLRVQSMLQSGELIMVSAVNGDHHYTTVVKRSK